MVRHPHATLPVVFLLRHTGVQETFSSRDGDGFHYVLPADAVVLAMVTGSAPERTTYLQSK